MSKPGLFLLIFGLFLITSPIFIIIGITNYDNYEIKIVDCYDNHHNKIIGQTCSKRVSPYDNIIEFVSLFMILGVIFVVLGAILIISGDYGTWGVKLL